TSNHGLFGGRGDATALDPVVRTWRDLPPPPGPVDDGLQAGTALCSGSGRTPLRTGFAIPATGRVDPLPEDPFGVTTHRPTAGPSRSTFSQRSRMTGAGCRPSRWRPWTGPPGIGTPG